MRDALAQLEGLLRDYGHVYEANLAAIVIETYGTDPGAACRLLNSDEWWDDSRSVAAIDLAVDGGFTAQARDDARRLRSALAAILATMQDFGEQNATGELIVAQFHKWAESHI